MTLPASGAISLSDVNVELGFSPTAPISLNDAAVRALFGKPTGAISLSDGYGKTHASFTLTAGHSGAKTGFESGVIGSVSPTTYAGNHILWVYWQSPAFVFASSNDALPQNHFATLTINGTVYSSAAATFANVPGIRTQWVWATDPSLVDTSVYPVLMA